MSDDNSPPSATPVIPLFVVKGGAATPPNPGQEVSETNPLEEIDVSQNPGYQEICDLHNRLIDIQVQKSDINEKIVILADEQYRVHQQIIAIKAELDQKVGSVAKSLGIDFQTTHKDQSWKLLKGSGKLVRLK